MAFVFGSWGRVIFALVAGVFLGLAQGGVYWSEYREIQSRIGDTVQIAGIVENVKANDGMFNFVLSGVYVRMKNEVDESDFVVIEGKLSDGFGEYAAAMWWPKLISISKSDSLDYFAKLRLQILREINNKVTDRDSAALVVGYLLGEKNQMSDELKEKIRSAGLSHMVAASGFHLAFFAGFVRNFLKKYSRQATLFATTAIILGFSFLTGLAPSMERAAIMAIMSLIFWYFGRKIKASRLIMYTAAIMLCEDPGVIQNIGFQYSMAAYFGIVIAYPIFERFLFANDRPSGVLAGICQGVIVQAICLPISIFNFGYATFTGAIASVILSPTVGILMMGGLLVCLNATASIPVELIAKFHLVCIGFFSKNGFMAIESESGNVGVFTMYIPIVVFLTTAYVLNRREERRHLEFAKIQKYGKIYVC